MKTCKVCGAPEGQRVFRHKFNGSWTQVWEIVCADQDYSPSATITYLDSEGLCRKCRPQPK